ncbi:hypothetical protein [Alkalihalobacillus trypoxylicola]|uniref:DUF3221 domain-containing protein n=1 Tax=Alkalihalobacillus trypoxylicola TaxID=519424 RepID=A0A162DH80_9BACI|nr:hypothetical protein [Alkalihalobacillus trypoxylicola]KYG29625.1 hypothetical protein AZF04_08915 [Alkalihalobacillus trypoxylicola]
MKLQVLSLSIMMLLSLSNCSLNSDQEIVVSTGEITASDVLEGDPAADIFQYEEVIYQTNIRWVDELDLTKDAELFEITEQHERYQNFEDGASNKLPVGTKVYSAKEREDVLLVEIDGELQKYYQIVEG